MSMGQHGRQICLLGIFAVLACLAAIVSIMKGSVEIPLPEILAALSGERGTHAQILMNIRLPRTIVALLVGVQGVAEFLVSGLLGGIVARAVERYLK